MFDLKNLFNKKEKPVRVYEVLEIGEKSLHTNYFAYIITKIVCYTDRIEFFINDFEYPEGDITTEFTEITAVAKIIDGERYLPLVISGHDFLWDTQEMVFRRKIMPEGEASELAPAVHIYPNEVLTIKRDFAEKYLTPLALSYSLLQDDERYIWYYPDGSCTPAILEIPKIFRQYNDLGMHPLSGHPIELINHTAVFAGEYLEKMDINTENYAEIFEKNYKREISFD